MNVFRRLLSRLSKPTVKEIDFVSKIGSIISIQLGFDSKVMGDVSRDPWVAGYFFGACMSFLEHEGFDMTSEDKVHGRLGMAAAHLLGDQGDTMEFLAFVGGVTGQDLANAGIAAAVADRKAFTASNLAPFRLAEHCMGAQAWIAYRNSVGAA